MQAKKPRGEKKINAKAQAPDLIRKARALGWTQKDLERVLDMKQQAVSTYLAGTVKRERYDVIKKLEEIIKGNLKPPDKGGDPAQESQQPPAIQTAGGNHDLRQGLPKGVIGDLEKAIAKRKK